MRGRDLRKHWSLELLLAPRVCGLSLFWAFSERLPRFSSSSFLRANPWCQAKTFNALLRSAARQRLATLYERPHTSYS